MHYSFFLDALSTLYPYTYIVLFIGMVLEGDMVLFTAAFLMHQGVFDPGKALLTAFLGVIFGDLLWYTLGSKLKETDWRIARWAISIAKPFDEHLRTQPFHTIFMSKFAYGFHHAILMRAGALRIKIKRFLKDDIASTISWMFIIVMFGYFSSASFDLIKHYIRFAEIALFVGLLIFFIIWHYLAQRLKKRL